MKTLKKGSQGKEVMTLQKCLKLNADGIFGSGTEKAVIAFQKQHGLTADGIVGEGTWKALGVTDGQTSEKAVDPCVIYDPLNVHITKLAGRSIKYIVIHYTAGASSKTGRARSAKKTFTNAKASADFAIDDAEIVQFNPDLENYYCWAVGDKKNPYTGGGKLYGAATNKNVVSIEICSNLASGTSAAVANHPGWTYTDQAVELALKLTKILMKKYNIPADRVIRHYDVSGKLCPGIVGWNGGYLCQTNGKSTSQRNNEDEWNKFKKALSD